MTEDGSSDCYSHIPGDYLPSPCNKRHVVAPNDHMSGCSIRVARGTSVPCNKRHWPGGERSLVCRPGGLVPAREEALLLPTGTPRAQRRHLHSDSALHETVASEAPAETAGLADRIRDHFRRHVDPRDGRTCYSLDGETYAKRTQSSPARAESLRRHAGAEAAQAIRGVGYEPGASRQPSPCRALRRPGSAKDHFQGASFMPQREASEPTGYPKGRRIAWSAQDSQFGPVPRREAESEPVILTPRQRSCERSCAAPSLIGGVHRTARLPAETVVDAPEVLVASRFRQPDRPEPEAKPKELTTPTGWPPRDPYQPPKRPRSSRGRSSPTASSGRPLVPPYGVDGPACRAACKSYRAYRSNVSTLVLG